jgi:hypothetical protein
MAAIRNNKGDKGEMLGETVDHASSSVSQWHAHQDKRMNLWQ